ATTPRPGRPARTWSTGSRVACPSPPARPAPRTAVGRRRRRAAGPPAPTRRNRPGSRAASSARRRRRRVRRPPARTPEDRAGTGCAARRRTTPQRSRAFEHSSVPLYELVDTVHVSKISGQRPLGSLSEMTAEVGRRRPRGAVRDGLVAAGLELARTGGPDAVLLREATRLV